jgi:putative endonuclease
MVVRRFPTPPLARGGAIPLLKIMYYVYLLRSAKDDGFYIGYSSDLRLRFQEHNNGEVKSTKYRRPLELIYYEAYFKKELAEERERKLKQFGSSYIALLKRLKLK